MPPPHGGTGQNKVLRSLISPYSLTYHTVLQKMLHRITYHYRKSSPSGWHLHSCLMSRTLMGMNGRRAARLVLRTCRQMRREMRVKGVVIRQNAARVFITGHGLPGPNVRPWPADKCRASSDLLRTSYTRNTRLWHYHKTGRTRLVNWL